MIFITVWAQDRMAEDVVQTKVQSKEWSVPVIIVEDLKMIDQRQDSCLL